MKKPKVLFLKKIICSALLLFALNGFSQDKISSSFQLKSTSELISARKITTIPDAISESSAIAVITPNRIWSVNDAGNTNEIFCFDTTGNLIKEMLISNAINIDWEDLTLDDEKRMYIGDAGNNDNDRRDLKIYRIPNPETVPGNVVQAEAINFTLEDQVQFPPPAGNRNYDIEAIIWKNDSLFLFTKNRCNPQTGICKLYSLPASPGTHTAKLKDAIFLGTTDKEARVTSADINLSTGELLLLTETKIVSFTDYPANRFFDSDMISYYFSNTVGQIEGVSFAENGRLYLTEEGTNNNGGYLYTVKWKNTNAISEQDFEKISLFPNPFTDEITIAVPFDKNQIIDIFDGNGNMVFQSRNIETQVNLGFLAPGIYFLRFTAGNQNFVRRIVKL